MERASAPAAPPAAEGSGERFDVAPVPASSAVEEKVVVGGREMAHSRGGEGGDDGATSSGATPKPNPSGSAGQSGNNMELVPTDDGDGGPADGDGAVEAAGDTGQSMTTAGSVNNPIDLTLEDNALQKALALSLQEMQNNSTGGAQISLEDQELSRALEASLAERQGPLQQIGISLAGVSVDPLNPHERKRLGQNPAGLKNIGNTCWFSAVIQSLFHIPEFRAVVLQFQPPTLPASPDQPHNHCLLFLIELRRLFALLVASHRKYINPQSAIMALKAAFTEQASVTAVQQDVSEFTHKLLEWIEIAFKTAGGSSDQNPVVKLFNGHCQTEGLLEGHPFVNESDFGAFPIQVQGHTHLHDSLEAACVSSDMGQETWFTALPPILVLELSRFSYNQTSSMAEKLHSRLAFDRTLSLDRYLQKNRDEVRMRRKEVASLKHKLSNLRRRLNRFTCYQGRPVSIQQVLQMTLDFASQQSSVVREGADGRNEEVEQEEEEDGRRRMERQSHAGTGEKCPRMSVGPEPRYVSAEERALLEQCLGRWKAEVEEDMTELRDSVLSTEDTLGAVYSDSSMNTVIYHLHAVLVHQGQASGGHYWSYVRKPSCLSMETSVPAAAVMRAGPRSSGCGSETVEKSQPVTGPATAMATDSGAGGVGGGVGGGIGRNQENKPPGKAPGTEKGRRGGGGGGWLKFNDVSVHEVGWEEVVKESYGGHHNTSAYCLIYLSPLLHQSWSTTGIESEVPADLKECVDEDNETFKQEMADYDAKKEEEERLRENEVVPGSEIQVATGAGSGGVGPSLNNRTATNYLTGQKPDRSPEQMQVDSPPLPPVDMALRQELMQLVQSAYHRLGGSRMRRNSHRETGETPANENENIRLRLLDISSYIILSELAEDERVTPALNVFLLQVVERESAEGGGRGGGGGGGGREELRLLIKKEIVSALIKPGTQQMMNELRLLHNQLKLITHHFTIGVHALIQKKLESALVHSVHAYRLNCDLIRKAGERAGLRNLVIGILRRKALKEVSKGAMVLFDRGDVPAALQTATNLLVPTLKSMSELRCPGDDGVMESVREEWCNCLTHPSLSGSEQDQLADLLTRMFEEFSKSPDLTMPSTPAQPVLEPNQLSSDYENVMHRLGEIVNS